MSSGHAVNSLNDDYRRVDQDPIDLDLIDDVHGFDETPRQHKRKWYEVQKFQKWILYSTYVRTFLVVAIVVLSVLTMKAENGLSSSTIHTQVLNDWVQKSWIDFLWSQSGACPDGYESIGVNWLGAKPFNVTNYGISVLIGESRYDTDYAATPAKMQTALYSGMKDALCGLRGSESYAETPIIDISSTGEPQQECPEGTTPCSTNPSAVGSQTYCMDQSQGAWVCPITELRIYEATSPGTPFYSQIDSKSAGSSLPIVDSGASQLVVEFTRTEGETNTPLQSLKWSLGEPCAYTDQENWFDQSLGQFSSKGAMYHLIEEGYYLEDCEKQDDRYMDLTNELQEHPNEYEVQKESGVYDFLTSFPFTSRYLPNAQSIKSKSYYSLYGRPTIQFSQSCGKPIGDAIEVQKSLNEAAQIDPISVPFLAIASTCTFFQIMVSICLSTCLCKAYSGHDPKFWSNIAMTQIFSFLASVALFITSAIVFARWSKLSDNMHQWHELSDCLTDDLSKVSEQDHQDINAAKLYATLELVLTSLYLAISTLFFVQQIGNCVRS